MSLCRVLMYINYWFNARSPLDIHSPFVYQIYARVLKDRTKYPEYRQVEDRYPNLHSVRYRRLLFQFSRFLKPGNIWFMGDNTGPERDYLEKGQPGLLWFPTILQGGGKVDMCFVDLSLDAGTVLKSYGNLLQHIHKESVIIAWNLRQSHSTQDKWKELKQLSKVTVTIDLFHVGLIFFNDNLSPEEFRLRF
jgi:hypothetical protein